MMGDLKLLKRYSVNFWVNAFSQAAPLFLFVQEFFLVSTNVDVMVNALSVFLFSLYTLSLVKRGPAIISTINCRQMSHKSTL